MNRPIIGVTTLLLALGLSVSPAVAGQCPALIAQIMAAAGNRFDGSAASARALSAQAKMLHDEAVSMKQAAKHAQSVAKAQEAAKAIGLTLKMK